MRLSTLSGRTNIHAFLCLLRGSGEASQEPLPPRSYQQLCDIQHHSDKIEPQHHIRIENSVTSASLPKAIIARSTLCQPTPP